MGKKRVYNCNMVVHYMVANFLVSINIIKNYVFYFFNK